MHDNSVLTAADVRRIIRHAKAAGLNQHLNELAVQRLNLNPDGFSILSIAVPFNEYRHGPAHHRVNAFLAVRGQAAPAEIHMDVLAGDWDELPEAPERQDNVIPKAIPEAALRNLIRKWISSMNHPQLSANPQARYAYERCITDLQELIREEA